jgi:uncharacterized protein (TIGR00251 family)
MRVGVKVKPNSKTEEVSREGDSLMVKVKEPARKGQANQALIKLLAEHFDIPQSQVRIISGFRSRNKVIDVTDR